LLHCLSARRIRDGSTLIEESLKEPEVGIREIERDWFREADFWGAIQDSHFPVNRLVLSRWRGGRCREAGLQVEKET
jgi:hypothetical protein